MKKRVKAGSLKVLQRYKTIDKLLRNSFSPVHINTIWTSCNHANSEAGYRTVQKRIILKDIQDLREGIMGVEAPIMDDGRGNYYYDKNVNINFSLFEIPINNKDFMVLEESLRIVRQFIGGDDILQFEESLNNFLKSINRESTLSQSPNIVIEESTNASGKEKIQILFEKITEKKSIMLSYKPFGGNMIHHAVSPYFLKEYNGRWFLFAYNDKYNRISNYGLDRIYDVKESLVPFNHENIINPKEYLKNIVGVTLPDDGELKEIVIRVRGNKKHYILTKPLHQSQQIKSENEEFIDISFKLIPNYEFFHKILSLGVGIEIVKPKEERIKIKNILTDILRQYDSPK